MGEGGIGKIVDQWVDWVQEEEGMVTQIATKTNVSSWAIPPNKSLLLCSLRVQTDWLSGALLIFPYSGNWGSLTLMKTGKLFCIPTTLMPYFHGHVLCSLHLRTCLQMQILNLGWISSCISDPWNATTVGYRRYTSHSQHLPMQPCTEWGEKGMNMEAWWNAWAGQDTIV